MGVHQPRRCLGVQRRDHHLGQGAGVEEARGPGPRGGQQPDAAACEPASDETQHRGARFVQPTHVVDGDEQGLVGRDGVQKGKGRIEDDEPLCRRPGVQAERNGEGLSMNRGEAVEFGVHGQQCLVESGIAHAGFEVDALRTQHPHAEPVGLCRGGCQQRGLADAGIASDQIRRAAATGAVQKHPEALQLVRAPDQSVRD